MKRRNDYGTYSCGHLTVDSWQTLKIVNLSFKDFLSHKWISKHSYTVLFFSTHPGSVQWIFDWHTLILHIECIFVCSMYGTLTMHVGQIHYSTEVWMNKKCKFGAKYCMTSVIKSLLWRHGGTGLWHEVTTVWSETIVGKMAEEHIKLSKARWDYKSVYLSYIKIQCTNQCEAYSVTMNETFRVISVCACVCVWIE